MDSPFYFLPEGSIHLSVRILLTNALSYRQVAEAP